LENFDARNKWSVLKKRPCAVAIIDGILLYFSLMRRSLKDMKYVESIATKMMKKIEYVDSSLTEIFLSNSRFVKAFSYGSCMVEIFMLLFMVGIPVIGILAKGPLSLSHFLSKLVILVILYMIFTIFWLLFTLEQFVPEISRSFRDPKVIERAKELIERGYNVLIVRGCDHKDFIVEGLQKYSINCKVIRECPRILDLFHDLYFMVLSLRWRVPLGLLIKSHFKRSDITGLRKLTSPLTGDDAIRT
jgi:hypothetical protein